MATASNKRRAKGQPGRQRGRKNLKPNQNCQGDLEQSETLPQKLPIIPDHCGLTFFDLPLDIRVLIYEYAGLWRPCVARVDSEQMQGYFDKDNICELEDEQRIVRSGHVVSVARHCRHPSFPMQLLLVSHAVREEVAPLFASRNNFSMVLAYKGDLDFFRFSITWAMGYLKGLHIELRPSGPRYLKLTGGVHNTTWKIWAAFCRLVREKMPRLRAFSLKCKVKLPEVADKLFADMNGFPTLANCAFHLHTAPNDEILSKTKRASWALTGNLDRPPFPFMRLPKEVQLLVLEFLLTRHSDAYIGSESNPVKHFPWTIVNFRSHRAHQLDICCGNCSPMQAMCFCASRQCSFSTSCFCFTSPVPCFLVSHEFYNMAHHIFYSRNAFAFVGEDAASMMRITTNMPTASFMQIRDMAFMVPAAVRFLTRSAYMAEGASLQTWSVWLRFVREHFDLKCLKLYFADFGTKNSSPQVSSHRKRYIRTLLKSFVGLRDLRDFRVYLADDPEFSYEARRMVLGDRAGQREPFYEDGDGDSSSDGEES